MPSTRIEDSHFEKTGRTADATGGGRGKREEIETSMRSVQVSAGFNDRDDRDNRYLELTKPATSLLKEEVSRTHQGYCCLCYC